MANAPSWPFAPFDSNYAPPQDPDTSTDYESAGAWAVASPFPSSANQIDHSNIVFDHPASFSTPFSPFPALAANDLGDLASEPAAVDLPSTGHDYTDLPGLEAAGHTIDPFLLAQPDYGTGGFTSDSEAHVDPGFAGASAAYRQPDQGDGGRVYKFEPSHATPSNPGNLLHCRVNGCLHTTFSAFQGPDLPAWSDHLHHEKSHFIVDNGFRCLEPYCTTTAKKWSDFERHTKSCHCKVAETIPCLVPGCKRGGTNGFKRADKLRSHIRNVHGKAHKGQIEMRATTSALK